jgi:hypothetical protein
MKIIQTFKQTGILYTTWINLFEMFRIGKSIDKENKLVVV